MSLPFWERVRLYAHAIWRLVSWKYSKRVWPSFSHHIKEHDARFIYLGPLLFWIKSERGALYCVLDERKESNTPTIVPFSEACKTFDKSEVWFLFATGWLWARPFWIQHHERHNPRWIFSDDARCFLSWISIHEGNRKISHWRKQDLITRVAPNDIQLSFVLNGYIQ